MNVSRVAVFMNAWLVDQNGFIDRGNRVQRFIFHLDEVHRVEGDVLVNCCDCRYRIADETNFVDAERMFVLADGKNSVRDWQILAGDNCEHAGQHYRLRDVDVFDHGVWQMSAENFAVEHARQHDVVRKLRLAGALRARVNLAKRLADHFESIAVVTVPDHNCWGGACPHPTFRCRGGACPHPTFRGQGRALPLQSFQSVDALARQLHFFTTHARGCQFHGFVDFYVAGAAAQIP